VISSAHASKELEMELFHNAVANILSESMATISPGIDLLSVTLLYVTRNLTSCVLLEVGWDTECHKTVCYCTY